MDRLSSGCAAEKFWNMGLVELGGSFVQEPHRQVSLTFAGTDGCRSGEALGGGEERACLGKESHAGFRQFDAVSTTNEQGGVDVPLQLAKLPGQCRLRDVQAASGSGDAAFFGDCDERLQMAELHVHLPNALPY